MKLDGRLSEIGRGVKQGSVLLPTIFLIVMAPLLWVLELRLSVNVFYGGWCMHACIC